jgi:hypothetical protein
MSDAIFIVGYYRSGTSALSGALAQLGVKFYNEADPNEHNPRGFFEIPELIQFDVDLFNRLGVEWTDVRGLPEGWQARADIAGQRARLEEILRRRFTAADPVWGLKHPHLCRTLPLYVQAARQAGHAPHVVHIFRDPWAAAASQQLKNGLTRAHALLLWMSYATSGERLARDLPRSWLTYAELMAGPVPQLQRLERELGVAFPVRTPVALRAAAATLTRELNRSAPAPRSGLHARLADLVGRCWSAIDGRDFAAPLWDGFAEETADLVGFLNEIGASKARALPAFGNTQVAPPPAGSMLGAVSAGLRPAERADDGARRRLELLRAPAGELPRLAVVIAAPSGRAHAINDTLASLRAQWYAPASIAIVAVEPVAIEGCGSVAAGPGAGELTRALCAALNLAARDFDYVAALNAGDSLAPDACLRFALLAAAEGGDMLYCDEVVPREGGAWVRHKPGWDVTRLRQSAYLGDWIWYRGACLAALGGFDPEFAGAEEYDVQLRLAEREDAAVRRLPEALFVRSPESRRDDIGADQFCARAAAAVQAHLTRLGMPAEVQGRQHAGLFHLLREVPDPGTAVLLLCDGAGIPDLEFWVTLLLTEAVMTGPVILAGAQLAEPVARYLTAVTEQQAALEGKVIALAPGVARGAGSVLTAALAMAATELVLVLDARMRPAGAQWANPHWAAALRARLADPAVAIAGARLLVPLGRDGRSFSVQGPIVIGADSRLGAGHLAEDPGPGGWLAVDQEASAIAPALLARRAALAGCVMPEALAGDALWIELGAQLRGTGTRLVWTPDASLVGPPDCLQPDLEYRFRAGATGAALSWQDPYHHPALSLRGDLLAPELRPGLVRAGPADPCSLLLSGAPEAAEAVLGAVRDLRQAGLAEASWSPAPMTAAELGRRAATRWLRLNPASAAPPLAPPYAAIFSVPPDAAPGPGAKTAIAQAVQLYATSPGLVRQVQRLAPPRAMVTLWRPGISRQIWQEFSAASGLNTKPRLLWVDDGNAPPWFAELMEATGELAAWIVVERPEQRYGGAIARLRRPTDEQGWAAALAEVAPHVLLRPAAEAADADCYPALLAAAAGCQLVLDERFDLPPGLPALRLPNRAAAWQRAVQQRVAELDATLAEGRRARLAVLAMAAAEPAAPAWAIMDEAAVRSAAE